MSEDEEGEAGEDSVPPEDKFGLPKLSTEAEMGLSMTLFVSGIMMVISVFYFHKPPEAMQAYVGLLLIGTAYLFVIESVRELNEKDHYLAEQLMKEE